MAESVRIEFTAGGIADVTRAFESVEKAIVKLQKASERESSRLSRDQVRQATQAGKERERILMQELKNRNRLEIEASKNATRLSIEGAKAFERAEKEKTRIFLQQERERSRAAQQAAREAARAASGPSFRQVVGGGIAKGAGSVASGVAKIGGLALAAGGGIAISDMMSYETALEKSAIELNNSIKQSGKKGMGADVIRAQARKMQAATGISAGKGITAAQKYQALTSDFDGSDPDKFASTMTFLGNFANATGGNLEDVAEMAGNIRAQNATMSEAQLKDALLAVVAQSGKGAIEPRDLAKVGGKITSTSSLVAGDQTKNQVAALGLAQIARQVTSAEEVGTVVSRFRQDAVTSKAIRAGALGKDVIKDGKIADEADLITRAFEKTGGDAAGMEKLGFGKESVKLFEALGARYETEMKANAHLPKNVQRAYALTNLKGYVKEMIAPDRTYGEKEMMQDAAAARAGRGRKTEEAFQSIRDKIADGLLPVLDKWIDKLPQILPVVEKLVEKFAAFASWVSDNPVKAGLLGLGAAITKEIVAQLATAQIGKLIGGAAGGGGGGGIGLGGAAGAALPVAAAAAGVAQTWAVGKGLIDAVTATGGENQAIVDKASGDRAEIERKRAQAKATLEVSADDLKVAPPMLMADKVFNMLGGKGSLMGGISGEQLIKNKMEAADYLKATDELGPQKASETRKGIETKTVSDFGDALSKATDALKAFGTAGERASPLADRPKVP